jgi:hypothetical protein
MFVLFTVYIFCLFAFLYSLINSQQVYNDFALLHMTEDFKLARHINTVCLPKKPKDLEQEFELEGCFATGRLG